MRWVDTELLADTGKGPVMSGVGRLGSESERDGGEELNCGADSQLTKFRLDNQDTEESCECNEG
jgi:hypothetical protein